MKETEILKIDSRGRIVIPRTMRRSLGLKENSHIMMVSDPDNNEVKMIPLPFSGEDRAYVKLRILISDEPGSLARIASVFGELDVSLLYGQTVVIKKGVDAEWSVISPVPDMPLDDLKKELIERGGAKAVFVEIPGKTP